jgi:broad specificity phosphatase PhoE
MAGESSFGQPIERRPEPGLLEIGQGSWEGLLTTEIEARWGELLTTWRRRPLDAWAPGGESIPEVQARLRPGLAGILAGLAAAGANRPPTNANASPVAGYREAVSDRPWSVVVGHDGVFKVALLTLFDLPLERFWMWSFDLCGIGVVEFRGGRPLVRALNLTEHLAPLLDEAAQEAAEERQRSGAM